MNAVPETRNAGPARPLLMAMRADLSIQPQTYLGRKYWVVKDPLALKYYRFEEEEFHLLQMLDGRKSMEEIQAEFQRRFAPQRISRQQLQGLISMLHRSGLIVATTPGQGRQLLRRRQKQERTQRWGALTNVLCLRFQGFDPDRCLGFLERRVGWFFSAAALLCVCAVALGALLLVTVGYDEFQAKLPAFHQFFAARNWIWLALTLAATKILHEFGHGIACKRFGGECHEMGLMILVLTPCLYCNVSDSWMLPSKWKRAAIGAAGMYVEIALASLCTFLWWFSNPGLLNYICLNIMFVCSVSTLLFNANPLMRYDGYYILSDLVEIPNLRQKASAILNRKLAKWVLGVPEAYDPFLPQRRRLFFAFYSIAAAVYRWVVTLSILWFLQTVFEPYGLQIVGQAIAALSLYCLVAQPVAQLVKFLDVPGRFRQVNKRRMSAWCLGLGTALAVVLFLPWPYYVACGVQIEPRDAASVYIEAPGTLTRVHVQAGEVVKADQPLLQLSDPDIDLSIDRLDGQRRQLLARLASLHQQALENDQDQTAAAELNTVRETLALVERQLEKRLADFQRLTVKAPASGSVIPPQPTPAPAGAGILPFWSGTPLQTRNIGAHLRDGVLVCRIGDPAQLRAVLTIDQTAIEQVHEGLDAEIVLHQWPGRVFGGKIEHISALDMKVAPRGVSAKEGGGLATVTDASGEERPLSTTYRASVSLDEPRGDVLFGSRGVAKIHAGSRCAATRIWRYVCQTFNM